MKGLLFNQDKNQFTLFTKALCSFLAFIMVFSTGMISCFAMGAGVPEKIELEAVLSDYIEEIVDLEDVKSIDSENTDENELYFNMKDDTTTVYSFSEPVTFTDKNGNLRCKDNSIVEQKDREKKKAGYDYSNGQNDYRINFSSDSSKGVLVEYGDISFSLAPISDKSAPGYVSNGAINNERFENFEYADLFGENTLLKYFPQINGIKEIITLDSRIERNTFESVLKTNGCTPVINEDGSVSLISSETGEEVQNFTAPFAFDNAYVEGIEDNHYCADCRYDLKKLSDNEYILSVTVSDKWLNSKDTVYPVTIDPTTSNISNHFDAGVYSSKSSNNYGNEQTCCFGRASEYGYGRVYTHFTMPTAIKKYATINSAYIWERETTGRTTTTYVTPYMVTGSWSETAITWSNKPGYNSSTAMTKRTINSKSTDDSSNPYWYKFDIKTAVKKWTDGAANYGLVFLSNEESNGAYNWRAFTSRTYSSSAMRPYTVINYTNDTTAPTAPSVSGNPSSWTNGNITLTAKSTDSASGVSHYSFSTTKGTYSWQTGATKSVTANGTYYVYAKDKAGNISSPTTVTVSKIDKTKPTAPTVTGNPTAWTNGNVTLTAKSTDSASGVSHYSFSTTKGAYAWQTGATKSVTANTTYYVYAKDAAGNISAPTTVAVGKIDKTKPTAPTVTGNPSSWAASATLTASATDTGSGIAGYSFSTAENNYTWQTAATKAVVNGTYYVYTKDAAGNISSPTTVTVSKVDNAPPTAPKVTGNPTAWTNKDVTLTAASTDAQSGVKYYSFSTEEKVYAWQTAATKTVSANGTYYVYAKDAVGRISAVTKVVVSKIDKTKPTAPTVTGNPTSWAASATLTASATDTGSGIAAYSFSTTAGAYTWQTSAAKAIVNGTYYVYVKDAAGNISAPTAVTVGKVDKTKPTAPTVTGNSTAWTNGNVTLTAKSTDTGSGVAAYSFSTTAGTYAWQTGAAKAVTANTTYYVYAKDAAGNISAPTTVTVGKIDKTKPTAPTVTGNPTSWKKDNTVLTASATDTGSGVAAYSFSTTAGTYAWQTGASKTITANGTYYVYAKDAAGNISAPTTATVSKIDNALPTAPKVTGNPTAWTNKDITLTAASTDSQSGVTAYSFSTVENNYTWQTANSYKVTANGTYYVYAKDAVGHISAVTKVVVSKIDKTKPAAPKITGNPTAWINKNITLTASTTDTGSGVAAYSFSTTAGTYAWQTGAAKAVAANVAYYVYAKDAAGNISAATAVTVNKIDKTAPVISDAAVSKANNEFSVTVTAKDTASGIKDYSFDGGKTWQTENTKKLSTAVSEITVSVRDNAGNTASKTVTVCLPEFYEDGALIGLLNAGSSVQMQYKIGDDGEWLDYKAPFAVPAFKTAAVYAKFADSASVVSREFTSKSEYYGTYSESNTDFTLNYKNVSFDFIRTYNSFDGIWFYSVNSMVYIGTDLCTAKLPDGSKLSFVKQSDSVFVNELTGCTLNIVDDHHVEIADGDITYVYEDYFLSAVKNNKYGDTITITRNEDNITVADETGRAYVLGLDEFNKIINITDPENGVITYTYNENDRITKVVDQSGVTLASYSYKNDVLSKSMDKEIIYDENGRVSSFVYDSGAYLNYTYDDENLTISAESSVETSSSETYNDAFLVVSSTDEDGNATEYTYDEYFRVASETSGGKTVSYTYDENGNVLSEVSDDEEAENTYYVYDENSNVIRQQTGKNYTYYVYNENGEAVLSATLKEDYKGNIPEIYNEGLTCFDVTQYTYTDGLLVKSVSENETTAYEYDEYGNAVKTAVSKTENGETTVSGSVNTYNRFGNLLTATNGDEKSSYIYDKAGRTLLADENGKCTRTIYDNLGRVIQEISPDDYDASKDGLPESNTYSDAKAGHTYKYAANGTLTSETNRLGKTTKYFYNDIGSKVREEFDIYKFYYLNHGELYQVKVSNVTTVSYSYDDNYNLTEERYANDDVVRYKYNANGDVVSQYHNSNAKPYVTYTYNADNELTEKVNTDAGLKYVYGENNQVSIYKLSDNSLVQSYTEVETEADEENGVEGSKTVNEIHFGTSYSSVVKDKSVLYSSNDNVVEYSYQTSVKEDDEKMSSDMVKNGDVTALSSAYAYDEDSNVTQKTVTCNSSTADFVNAYDKEGRITTASAFGKNVNYTYDENDQLVSADGDNYNASYSYDARGNITSKLVNGETTSFTYANTGWKDQLVSVNGTELTYDAVGNVLTYGDKEYLWNTGRHLASITDGDNEYTYTYDENGIRTSKTVKDNTTYFNTKDGVILSQTDGTNTMYFQYDNSGTPLGFVYNETQYFYVTNQMGDVIGITEANGNLIVQYLYDDWGKLVSIDTADEEASTAYREIAEANPLRYRGYYYDNETGYYYLQSRYYAPEICRFINADVPEIAKVSKDNILGINIFIYCSNDPINNDDPTGEFSSKDITNMFSKLFDNMKRVCNYLLDRYGVSTKRYKKTTKYKTPSKVYKYVYENKSKIKNLRNSFSSIATFLEILLTVINAASILSKNRNQSLAVAELLYYGLIKLIAYAGEKLITFIVTNILQARIVLKHILNFAFSKLIDWAFSGKWVEKLKSSYLTFVSPKSISLPNYFKALFKGARKLIF